VEEGEKTGAPQSTISVLIISTQMKEEHGSKNNAELTQKKLTQKS